MKNFGNRYILVYSFRSWEGLASIEDNKLIEIRKHIEFDDWDIKFINNLYWKQVAVVQVVNTNS